MSAAIEFGMALRTTELIGEMAARLEGLGYDYITSGEHLAFHVPTPNSFISLAVAAEATERVRLLSGIVPLPLYPPVLAAKLGAALDVASGGRYEMGVGVGGEFPAEFEAVGIPLKERGARCNEALDIILRCWTETDVSYEGRFNQFRAISIMPPPLQNPHPPIWISGRKDAAIARAAKFGNGWMPYMYTPEMLERSATDIRRQCNEAGRDSGAVRIGLFIFASCHADHDTAVRYAVERLGAQYAQDFERLTARYVLAGTPQECADRLREYVNAGARTVFLSSVCPDEYLAENQRLLAEEVIPAFR